MGTDAYATGLELDGNHSPGEDRAVLRGEIVGSDDAAGPLICLSAVGEELERERSSVDRL